MPVPTTVAFPADLDARPQGDAWVVTIDGVEVRLSNLGKVFWGPEGYTKADLCAYYLNIAPWALPYVRDRPLTLKRMPDGADGEFFYAKQAPGHTPGWVRTVGVVSRDTGKRIDYLLAEDAASLVWLANLGCIELHPWHSRVDDLGHPDYAFFDLDPFGVEFGVVRDVALHVRAALAALGLRSYPRTSGATGMQVYVPIDRVHSYGAVREWVGRVCRLIHRADPDGTTMAWQISDRTGKVFLDHAMNTEGRNIAGAYSLRPEREAPVATPLAWDEVEAGASPRDFTIATIWSRLEEVGDLFHPVVEGGQDLRSAMERLGMDPGEDGAEAGHDVVAERSDPAERLRPYLAKRDFARTSEPAGVQSPGSTSASTDPAGGPRFVVQHHLATRLHHDLRLERDGVAVSWAVPKGLPGVRGLRHLAVQTEDHPLEYMTYEGEIPEGEYGAGPVRIWDSGTYELQEWTDDKVTVRLAGTRHRGSYHLVRTGGEREPNQWIVLRRDEPSPEEMPARPPRIEPMLAMAGGQPFDDDGWYFEVKWDGVRAVATCVRPGWGEDGSTLLRSRLGNDITPAYPELAALWERVLARNAVLDGEICALDLEGRPSFERLQHRMHLRDPVAVERAAKRIAVVYLAYDVLAIDGESLVDRPLEERFAVLEDVLVPGTAVRRSQPVRGDGIAMFEAVRERGLEGLVAKRAASRYAPGKRTRDWLKIKLRRTVDCVVGGWLPGEGGRSGAIGALLVGLYDEGRLRYVGRVGSGFNESELRWLSERLAPLVRDDAPFADPPRERLATWVTPELVCEVEYAEITSAGRLRAPSYKGVREGAEPRECLLDEVGA